MAMRPLGDSIVASFRKARAQCRWDVHPHGRQEDKVESETQAPDLGELGQAVGQPVDPRRPVQRTSVGSHCIGRLDGNDIVAIRCKPSSIATRACANVKDRRARLREQIEQCRVYVFKRQRFVLGH